MKKTETPDISFIVPAHNEEGNIESLVHKIAKVGRETKKTFEIIVVNDNSTDNSAKHIAKECRKIPELRQLIRKIKPGVGNAIQDGLKAAKADIIITLDGDMSHDPKESIPMLKKIQEYDIVCGSRRVSGGKATMDPLKRLISNVFNFSFQHIIGLPVKDFTSGFRCYRRKVFDDITLTNSGFGIYIEIPIKAYLAGFLLTESPITYHQRKEGKTNLNYFVQGPKYLKVAFQALVSGKGKKK